MFPDADGSGDHGAPVFGGLGVVQGSQYHVVADEGAVADVDAHLVLEFAAHVDKNVFSNVDVFPTIGIEGGKQAKALIHRGTDELREEGTQFLRLVIAAVDLGGDAQRLLADAVHELVGLAAALHGVPLFRCSKNWSRSMVSS